VTHYHRQLLLSAAPAAVYQALSTQQGLRGWWTEICDVPDKVGGLATFRFGATHKVMRIDRLEPEREVRWHCVEADIEAPGIEKRDEWLGTDIVFRLSRRGSGETVLDVEHIGLVPSLQCYAICNSGWDYFLASLKAFVGGGKATPFLKSEIACLAATA
jgi:uncharacterized protein YndB with AHSA1/START domain